MGEIVPFKAKRIADGNSDFTAILASTYEDIKKSFIEESGGIATISTSFEEVLRARIGEKFIWDRKINPDLFRCGLYVSGLMSEMISNVPQSFYAVDYFQRGMEESDPKFFKEGADLCCTLCVAFPGRLGWKATKTDDYYQLGIQMYALYYSETKKQVAWCMSRNFREIVSIARFCFQSF